MCLLEMGVPQSGLDVGVSEDCLNLVDAHSVLNQAGGVRVSQGMDAAIV
jgi:hypothetical protein